MTITATPSQIVYLGDGVTLAFAIPYVFDTSADLKVILTDAAGTPAEQITGFSIGGGAGSTGTCTFLVAPAVGYKVTILDDPELTQPVDYTDNDAFAAQTHEGALDRCERQIKRLHQRVERSIRVEDGDDSDGDALLLPIEASRAGKFLAFDADGQPVASAGTGGGDSALRTDLASTVAGSEGASLVGFRAASASSIARSVRSKLRDVCDVRDFGVIANGVTDDTTSLQAALASGEKHIYFPGVGQMVVSGSVPINSDQHLQMQGSVFKTTGNTQVFTVADGTADFSIRGRWGVVGDNNAAGSLAGTGAALKIIGGLRFHVDGPIGKSIRGWNVLVQPGASVLNRAEHGIIVAPQAYGCYVGHEAQAGTGAEYITFVSPHAARCDIGHNFAAGNINSTGGSATDNRVGLKIGNGTNHAHGIISGMSINHNTDFNLHCDNVTNGQTLKGCHFYQGAIFLDHCKGILILGGILDCPVYNYKGVGTGGVNSGYNWMRDMWVPAGGTGFSRQAGTNNGHDELIIRDFCGPGAFTAAAGGVDPAGLTVNDVSDMHVLAKRAAGSTQAFVSGVAQDCLFNTEVFDRRLAYTPGTGITVIPAEQYGTYRITGNLVFVGTAMSAIASFVELKVGGTAMRLFLPTIFGTTKLVFPINAEIYLNAADAVKLTATITGTTPVLGDAVYESYLSIEKIA